MPRNATIPQSPTTSTCSSSKTPAHDNARSRNLRVKNNKQYQRRVGARTSRRTRRHEGQQGREVTRHSQHRHQQNARTKCETSEGRRERCETRATPRSVNQQDKMKIMSPASAPHQRIMFCRRSNGTISIVAASQCSATARRNGITRTNKIPAGKNR